MRVSSQRAARIAARPLLWIALAALALSIATVVAMNAYTRSTAGWVEHTTAVYQTMRSGIFDLSAGARSGAAIAPTDGSIASGLARLDSVVQLTADNPAQLGRARTIRELAGEWSRRVAADSATAAGLALGIRSSVGSFLGEERRLYAARSVAFERALLATDITIPIELAAVAAIVIVYARRVEQYVADARADQERLEEQATEVEEQAAELELSNQDLQAALTAEEEARAIAEEHVRERERTTALLNASLDGAPAAFALLDPELNYLRVNARWAELTGTAAAAHAEHSFAELPFSRDVLGPALSAITAARLSSRSAVNVELSGHPTSDAATEPRHWLLSAVPVAPTQTVSSGVAVALLDVTEHTKTAAQLLHVQKMEAVGRLAGGIAHDFNNSLAVINAYASMMSLDDGLSGENRERVDEITAAVERAAGLTQQLLAFGRRQISQPRQLDVGEVLNGMTGVLGRLVPANIALESDVPTPMDPVLLDPSQLEQVVLNLVTNATHAMPDGGTLAIEADVVDLDATYAATHVSVAPGRYVVVTVSDTGTGMDAATMSRIFEPFFTTKSPGQGTGLGLASVYAIAKNAGGNVWCYSEPGRGTTFKVYFPVATQTAEAPAHATERAALRTQQTHVLLVEDDAKLRPAVARLLEQTGFTVTQARDGNAALELLEQVDGAIDLVITDLVMPGISGRELSEFVKARYPTLPVMFTSGYTDDNVMRLGMLERGYTFVQKPFTRDQLLSAIDVALRARPRG